MIAVRAPDIEGNWFDILMNPMRAEIDSWVDTDTSKYLVIICTTPRESIDKVEDYSFMLEDCARYSRVVQPFWSDCEESVLSYLDLVYNSISYKQECYWNNLTIT